ncbi:MipA/OmpV family protein [Paraglaciecola arctica]|uniref:Outer membrane protein n=1 Tax=Paraglaciecola arctica BSs20135 TaxID=493475 RepID=K6Y9M4_9ALTE|nr:MipA/OmpV family protein [Paraglaciecola arctica]GAC20661.1 outer membrane protein [Paraglaciecola arctica BSs20135]
MNSKKLLYVVKLLILILLAKQNPTHAQQTPMQNSEGWRIKVGAAAIASAPAWVGNDEQVSAVPYFSAQYCNWSFGVENLVKYQLPITTEFTLSWGLNLRADGFDPEYSLFNTWSKDDVFDGYESPDTELLLHSNAQWSWLRIGIAYDVTDNSGASSGNVSLTVPVFDNHRGMQIKVTIAADAFSKQYVNYYYGITSQQANLNLGRNKYLVDEYAVKVSMGIQMIYPFNRQWSLMANVKYTQLDDVIVDSPLIENDNEQQAIMALVYSF